MSKKKKDKQRDKLDALLHIDHSDVYFENDRLDFALGRTKEHIEKQFHQLTVQHDADVQELKQTIFSFQAMKSAPENYLERPKTPNRPKSRSKSGRRSRLQSSNSYESGFESDVTEDFRFPTKPRSDIDESDDEKALHKAIKKRLRKLTKKTRDPRNFPKEWYTSVLPASDAAIHRNNRLKSAPPGALRSRPGTVPGNNRAKSSKTFGRPTSANTISRSASAMGDAGMHVICEKPVKPVVMSRRMLMEMSHTDNMADKIPNTRLIRQQVMLEVTNEERKLLNSKVKVFIKEMGEKITKDIEDTKAKEKEKPDLDFVDDVDDSA